MFLKYCLLSILLIHCINCKEINPSSKLSISKTVQEKYNDLTTRIVSSIKEAFHNAIDKGSIIAQNIHEETTTLIQKINISSMFELSLLTNNTLDIITNIKKQAIEIGDVALECVTKEEHRVPASHEQTVEDNKLCFQTSFGQADEVVNEAVQIPINSYKELKKSNEDWKNCDSWWIGSYYCRKGVVSSFCNVLEKIGLATKKLLVNLDNFEVQGLFSLVQCTDRNIKQHDEVLKEVIIDMEKCIQYINL